MRKSPKYAKVFTKNQPVLVSIPSHVLSAVSTQHTDPLLVAQAALALVLLLALCLSHSQAPPPLPTWLCADAWHQMVAEMFSPFKTGTGGTISEDTSSSMKPELGK
jgi:hypothetical protein